MIKFINILSTLNKSTLITSSCMNQSTKSKFIIKNPILQTQRVFFSSKKHENKPKKYDYQKNKPKPLSDYL